MLGLAEIYHKEKAVKKIDTQIKAICTDLGGALVKCHSNEINKRAKEGKDEAIKRLIMLQDTNQYTQREMLRELNKYYFKKPMNLSEFARLSINVWGEINLPLLEIYRKLKRRGIRFVCVSDIGMVAFYALAARVPEIFDLFVEKDFPEGLCLLSHENLSLKRSGISYFHLNKYGLSLKDCLFIDDILHNLNAAIIAGFPRENCFTYRMENPHHNIFLKIFLNVHLNTTLR